MVELPIGEVIGRDQEHVQSREPLDHLPQLRRERRLVERVGRRHVDAQVPQLREVRGQRGQFEVVDHRPVEPVRDPAGPLRLVLQPIDRLEAKTALRLPPGLVALGGRVHHG
ncbi:MAG: hypothetical protein ACO3ZY_13775 [Phycisphaerales bacterium]